MSYLQGLPDLVNYFTYYINDSAWIDYRTQYNTPEFNARRNALFSAAASYGKGPYSFVVMENRSQNAIQFISQVAENERAKEVAAVKNYCNKHKKEFPSLEWLLDDPNAVLNNPQAFYKELITALNKMRKGSDQYLKELQLMQQRIKLAEEAIKNGEQRSLENYAIEDYRYRTDIQSFANRLTNNYNIQSGDKFLNDNTVKLERIVMNILEKLDIASQISTGEDFVAIASAVYLDVEKKFQDEYDSGKEFIDIPVKERMSAIIDQIGTRIEQDYLQDVKRQDKQNTAVQRALNHINGNEYTRIIDNVKETLGITTMTDAKDLAKRAKTMRRISHTTNKQTQPFRNFIKDLTRSINTNQNLRNDLNNVKMSISGSKWTRHGNINEAVLSILSGDISKVKGSAAVDLLTLQFDPKFDNTPLQKLMDDFIDQIGREMTTIAEKMKGQADNKDSHHQNTLQDLEQMNENINTLVKQIEEKIKASDEFKDEQFFVYHESLKLYSSVETGKTTHGFGGRTLAILNYIDEMYSASSGYRFPISRDEMAFLGLNLSPDAAASRAIGPLEKFFSIFAGMIMFDDVSNMAQAAIEQTKANSTVVQVHLYNLNGIYVPASFLLSYVADQSKKINNLIETDYAAKAHISVPKTNKTYSTYKKNVSNKISNSNTDKTYYLRLGLWEAVANENAQNTKVEISFLKSFITFINELGAI